MMRPFDVIDTTGLEDTATGGRYGLDTNFPNPFAASTEIGFVVPAAGSVTIEIFDVRGRLVKRVVDGRLPVGRHAVRWDGRDAAGAALPSGVYMACFRAGGIVHARPLSLVR